MKNLIRFAVLAVLCVMISRLDFAQVVYKAVKVPGASPNSLIAINNSGQVVVNTSTNGMYQVSVWDRIHGAQSLGLSGTNSAGADINSWGDVAGAGDPEHTGNLQAFVWRPVGGVQWLGALGGNLSAARGTGDGGAVVGLAHTAANLQHAFFWTQTGGMLDLTPGLTSSGGATAACVNASNQVVGYYYPNGSRNTLGFIWSQANGFQNLGATGTLANAINDAGTVVGHTPSANGGGHAFSWTQAGGIKDLGTLGGSQSSAVAINSQGWIVGTSLTSTGGTLHGFLWTPTDGMKDFTVLAALSAAQQAYSLQVNNSGVVAIATNKGAYILIPKITSALVSSANPSVHGQAVTFTATLTTFAGPPPDGEIVQFLIAGKVAGSGALKNGVATFTTSTLAAGSYTVQAKYNGDTNHLAIKSAVITQVVN